MAGAILFAPHNDDETLFAFYQMLRLRPLVVVVTRSYRQEHEQHGPSHERREEETHRVCELVDVPYVQWSYPDTRVSWQHVAVSMDMLVEQERPDTIIAPAIEDGGHEDHNALGAIVQERILRRSSWTTVTNLVSYLTYRRGHGRSTDGDEVEATDDERTLKLQAMGLYLSQAEHPATAPWFDPNQYGDLREWVK